MSLKSKKVLVGLTGGIACYKVPNLVRLLTKAGAEVRVIMTEHATEFITPLTLETVSKNPVALDMFPEDGYVATRHIELAQWPDLIVIAPATANFLGKAANGISDDLLTTIICASDRPTLLAPAMNPGMWQNKVTQKNFKFLTREMDWDAIGPEKGEMAENQWGVGRMSEPEAIFKQIETAISRKAKKKVLTGKRVLVTAGPCREPLDPVRYISNRSSGKMGFALAEAARDLGADTTLITGPTSLTDPQGIAVEHIETTADLHSAVTQRINKTDILIMAAAPSDFRPARSAREKIKKADAELEVKLEPTVDILASLAKKKKKSHVFVGFAVETENAEANARKKLKAKNLDLIVLNNPRDKGAAFDHDTNRVTVLAPRKKPTQLPLMSKSELALKLVEMIADLA